MRQRQCDAFYCLCIELYLILGFFSPVRPAPAIVSVMSDDHFLCFLLWWWQSGSAVVGPFIPRPVSPSPPQVYTLQLSEQCVQCTVHRVVTSVLSCRPPRRLPPSPAPHLTVSPCGAAVGWAGLSTQNIQTIPNIVTQSGSASPTHRYVNVLCHCQL